MFLAPSQPMKSEICTQETSITVLSVYTCGVWDIWAIQWEHYCTNLVHIVTGNLVPQSQSRNKVEISTQVKYISTVALIQNFDVYLFASLFIFKLFFLFGLVEQLDIKRGYFNESQKIANSCSCILSEVLLPNHFQTIHKQSVPKKCYPLSRDSKGINCH